MKSIDLNEGISLKYTEYKLNPKGSLPAYEIFLNNVHQYCFIRKDTVDKLVKAYKSGAISRDDMIQNLTEIAIKTIGFVKGNPDWNKTLDEIE